MLVRTRVRCYYSGVAAGKARYIPGSQWCDGEVVTLRPAKPPFVGSNPTRTSL